MASTMTPTTIILASCLIMPIIAFIASDEFHNKDEVTEPNNSTELIDNQEYDYEDNDEDPINLVTENNTNNHRQNQKLKEKLLQKHVKFWTRKTKEFIAPKIRVLRDKIQDEAEKSQTTQDTLAKGALLILAFLIAFSFTAICGLGGIAVMLAPRHTIRQGHMNYPITIMIIGTLLACTNAESTFKPYIKAPYVYLHKGDFQLNKAYLQTVTSYIPCDLLTIKDFLQETNNRTKQLCNKESEELLKDQKEDEETFQSHSGKFSLMKNKYTKYQGEHLCEKMGGSLPEIIDPKEKLQLKTLMREANIKLVPAGYFFEEESGRYLYRNGLDMSLGPDKWVYITQTEGIHINNLEDNKTWNDIPGYEARDYNYAWTKRYQTFYALTDNDDIKPNLLQIGYAHTDHVEVEDNGLPVSEIYTIICQNVRNSPSKETRRVQECRDRVARQRAELIEFNAEFYGTLPDQLPGEIQDPTTLMENEKKDQSLDDFLTSLTLKSASPKAQIEHAYVHELRQLCSENISKLKGPKNRDKRAVSVALQIGGALAGVALGIYEYTRRSGPEEVNSFLHKDLKSRPNEIDTINNLLLEGSTRARLGEIESKLENLITDWEIMYRQTAFDTALFAGKYIMSIIQKIYLSGHDIPSSEIIGKDYLDDLRSELLKKYSTTVSNDMKDIKVKHTKTKFAYTRILNLPIQNNVDIIQLYEVTALPVYNASGVGYTKITPIINDQFVGIFRLDGGKYISLTPSEANACISRPNNCITKNPVMDQEMAKCELIPLYEPETDDNKNHFDFSCPHETEQSDEPAFITIGTKAYHSTPKRLHVQYSCRHKSLPRGLGGKSIFGIGDFDIPKLCTARAGDFTIIPNYPLEGYKTINGSEQNTNQKIYYTEKKTLNENSNYEDILLITSGVCIMIALIAIAAKTLPGNVTSQARVTRRPDSLPSRPPSYQDYLSPYDSNNQIQIGNNRELPLPMDIPNSYNTQRMNEGPTSSSNTNLYQPDSEIHAYMPPTMEQIQPQQNLRRAQTFNNHDRNSGLYNVRWRNSEVMNEIQKWEELKERMKYNTHNNSNQHQQ